MPKILKNTKKAIETRNRVRFFRGVQSIMAHDSAALLNVNGLRKKMINQEEILHNERSTSSNNRLLNLSSDLRTWAIEKNIKKRAVTALLKILRSAGINTLPKDSRSLLETPRKVVIVDQAGGKYWHNGLENCLVQAFSNLSSNLTVEININIDGLPIFKSSPMAFWPILMNVHGTYGSYCKGF